MRSTLERGKAARPWATLALGLGVALSAIAAALGAGGLTAGAAADEPSLPAYDGSMRFWPIQDAAGPEEFSWRVTLGPEQELVQTGDQSAAVLLPDEEVAMGIGVAVAHDSDGAMVPTSLLVTQPDVVTLVVHHREGNPAAGGAPFHYPIYEGVPLQTRYEAVVDPNPTAEPSPPVPAPVELPTTASLESLVKHRMRAVSVNCRRLRGGPATSRWSCAVETRGSSGTLRVRAHLNPTRSQLVVRAAGHGVSGFIIIRSRSPEAVR